MDPFINYFGVLDYILLGGTLLISLLIGLYFGYVGNKSNEELLVGGRNMSVLPVAASIMVSYVSAITIIGFPSEVYAHGSQVYIMQIVSALGIICSPWVFVPFFYPMRLTSVNEYLELRFNSVWVRWLASIIFILQTTLLNGVVLYAPSIALEVFLGVPMWMSILGTGVCATVYTSIGGIKAVVWTDVFQFVIMVAGMVLIVWKGFSAAGGVGVSLQTAVDRGRVNFLDFTFDPFSKHNFWNVLFGMGFHAFMMPGVHQLQVQRYCGMPSRQRATMAIIVSAPLKLLIMTLCLFTGYALFAFYANCDPLATGQVSKSDQILPYFVTHEASDIPGIVGILTSCMFCAVLSSLSSCLNSMAAVTWEDFLVRIPFFKKMSSGGQTNVTRIVGLIYGVILIVLAFYAKHLGGVFTSSYAVVLATAGVLYGVFIMAIFLPFVDSKGATGGGCVGLVTVLILRALAFKYNTSKEVSLPTSTDQCPIGLNITVPMSNVSSLEEWPWKIVSLSYLLYPIVGSVVTLVVGIFITCITSRCLRSTTYRKKLPRKKHVHPCVRNIFSGYISPENSDENRKGAKIKEIPLHTIVT